MRLGLRYMKALYYLHFRDFFFILLSLNFNRMDYKMKTSKVSTLSAFVIVAAGVAAPETVLAEPGAMPPDNDRDARGCVISYKGIENYGMNYAVFEQSDCPEGVEDTEILYDRRAVAEKVIVQEKLERMDDMFVDDVHRYLQGDGTSITRDETVSFLQTLRESPAFPVSALYAAFNDFSLVLCEPEERAAFEKAYKRNSNNIGFVETPLLKLEDLHPAFLCPVGM